MGTAGILLILCILVTMPLSPAHASGLQPVGTSAPVSVQHVGYEIEQRDMYVSGVMEVTFVADSGTENSGNLRFPLPPGSVLHKAEIYLPAQERWETAETVGRREGEVIYEEVTNQEQPVDPLLIQRIGTDFYRARVYPIDEAGSLRIRVHYAHVLERTETGAALRVAFANPDSTAATPAGGVSIVVTLDPSAWNSGNWWAENEPDWQKEFDGGAGCATLYYDELFTMDRDIVLDLATPGGCDDAGALHYASGGDPVPDHVDSWWIPDLSSYYEVDGTPRSVVFVIDRSGSMGGAKIEETKKAVITCINQLAPEDWFGVVAFDTTIMKFSGTMTPGTDTAAAIDWVRALHAGGGTNIGLGLVEGAEVGVTSPLEGASIDLLLITDAGANVGTTTSGGILTQLGGVADGFGRGIRVFGCGMGSDVVQTFVNDLAHATGAEATFALDDAEITGQITDLFTRIRGGGVSGITTDIQYAGLLEGGPFTWRRVFPGTMIRMGAKGAPDGLVSLTFAGVTPAMEAVDLTREVGPVEHGDAFERIAAPLAAKSWADRLERRIDETVETDALVDEAVCLAKTYGIVTRYSSLLALETPELYEEYGVERIARDPAGVALVDVTGSSVAERRIGGSGTWDADVSAGGFVGAPLSGLSVGEASCVHTAAGRGVGAWLLVLAALAGLRAARRRGRGKAHVRR